MDTDVASPTTQQAEECANCNLPLTGPYCAACGQSAHALKRPAWEFIEHALEVLVDFDARGLKSILLLFVPGEMTAQYLAGRRARFVPPVRFYILVSLAFFLAIWATNTAIVQFYNAGGSVDGSPDHPRLGTKLLEPLDTKLGADAKEAADRLRFLEIDGKIPAWIARAQDGLQRGVADPKLLNERMSGLFPKVMFALVPLFGLLSRLLYLLRGRYLIEHLIFALHFHTLAFILATALILLSPILPDGFAGWFFFLSTAFYLLFALRRVFGGSWFGTAVREAILLTLYGTAFLAGMLFLLGASLSEI